MRRMIGVAVLLGCWAACAPVDEDEALGAEVDQARSSEAELEGTESALLWGPDKYTLLIDVAGDGYVLYSKPPDKALYQCHGPRCRVALGGVTRVLLRPVGNFAGWSGACTGTSACDVTVSRKTSVTASFR
ncbi:MAG: hypothetical protein ABW352_06295 [Polyangiales bacterium]